MKPNKAVVKITARRRSRDLISRRWCGRCSAELVDDPDREGLRARPSAWTRRCASSPAATTRTSSKIVNGALFTVKYDEMVIVKDIEFFSLCEHHMLPFFGKVHVAYLPKDRVIGLSKIPRIVDVFARRLQIQERMTQEIAQTIQELIDPLGVGVVCEARHFCMMMRGVEKQHSGAMTSAMLGAFRDRKETRDEFLSLVAHSSLNF